MGKLGKPNIIPAGVIDSELDAPVWSVISFELCDASNLTYPEAVEKAAQLEKKDVTGLCIVTDDVGARISTKFIASTHPRPPRPSQSRLP